MFEFESRRNPLARDIAVPKLFCEKSAFDWVAFERMATLTQGSIRREVIVH